MSRGPGNHYIALVLLYIAAAVATGPVALFVGRVQLGVLVVFVSAWFAIPWLVCKLLTRNPVWFAVAGNVLTITSFLYAVFRQDRYWWKHPPDNTVVPLIAGTMAVVAAAIAVIVSDPARRRLLGKS